MNMPVQENAQKILHKDIVLETVQQALTFLIFRVFFHEFQGNCVKLLLICKPKLLTRSAFYQNVVIV